jgi:hypothetical protein
VIVSSGPVLRLLDRTLPGPSRRIEGQAQSDTTGNLQLRQQNCSFGPKLDRNHFNQQCRSQRRAAREDQVRTGARNSFGLASAKSFLISAACLRKIGAINSLPFGVSDTTRTRRSSGLSSRLTRPLSTRRSTAVLIEPGVRYTFGPIVFTGKGPFLRSASSIRSVSSIPVSSSPAYRYFAAARKAFPNTSQQTFPHSRLCHQPQSLSFRIVAHFAGRVEIHGCPVFSRVCRPMRQAVVIRIPGSGKAHPGSTKLLR